MGLNMEITKSGFVFLWLVKFLEDRVVYVSFLCRLRRDDCNRKSVISTSRNFENPVHLRAETCKELVLLFAKPAPVLNQNFRH